MQRYIISTFAGLAVASVLFASINLGHADDATNTAASPGTNGISIKLTAGLHDAGDPNYYGLPKEAFDRLTPDQIMTLAQAHQNSPASSLESIANQTAPVLVSIAMFTMIAVCVALGVTHKLKRSRMMHDTIRLMIEKGQPIPPELLQPEEPQRRPRNDLRNGLLLIGIGAGLVVLLLMQRESASAWPAGLIPLLMGVAFLITWKIEANKNGQSK
jgi:hypothetical protein